MTILAITRDRCRPVALAALGKARMLEVPLAPLGGGGDGVSYRRWAALR
jgi:hypothetical protein